MKAEDLLAVVRKLERHQDPEDMELAMVLEVLHEKVADLEFAEVTVAQFERNETDEDYYEPTELDEWLDFDPDC